MLCERCHRKEAILENTWLGLGNFKQLCQDCANEWSKIWRKHDLSSRDDIKLGERLFREFLGEKYNPSYR